VIDLEVSDEIIDEIESDNDDYFETSISNVIKNTSAVRDEGIMNDLEVIDEIMKMEANAVKNNHVKKTNNSVTKGTNNPSINTFTENQICLIIIT
jgi:hypothetical protein